jgi:hypothetical protein
MERKEYIRAFEIFKSITDNESLAVTPHLIKASECAFFAEEHDFAFFSLHTIIKKCFYHKTEKITAEKDEDLLSHLLNMFYLNFPFCILDHNRELKKIFDTEKEVRDFFTKDKNINQEVKSNYLYFSAKAYLNLYKIMKNEDYIKTAFEMSRKLKKIKTAKPFLSSLDRELKKLYSKEELATIKLIYS